MDRKSGKVEEFNPNRVRPLPDQPRKRFSGIKELAESMTETGQISPGLVTLIEGGGDGPADFDAQLIDGERRLRACRIAGIPFRAEIRPDADAEKIFALSFAANFGKQNHDPIEIAEALGRLRAAGNTPEKIGRIAGHSLPWVYQYLNLLKLHPSIWKLMIPASDGSGTVPILSLTAAGELVNLTEPMQVKIARKIEASGGLDKYRLRRIVEKQCRLHGIERASWHRSLAQLQSLIENFGVQFGGYLDLPGAEINALIDSAGAWQRGKLVEKLEELAENAGMLAESITERIKANSASSADKQLRERRRIA